MIIADDWAGDVLKFWFEETKPEQWFKKDPAFDAAIRRRFLALHEVLAASTTEALFSDARTALAAVIVFDQMSRNMFRDSARAFATDTRAREVAERAIARGFDQSVPPAERVFFYLPFEHAEDMVHQERCIALVRAMGNADLLKWAELHADIIRRFGRFPHRNPILGRNTTPQEQAFLDGGGFGG